MAKIGLEKSKSMLEADIYNAFNKIMLATSDPSATSDVVNPAQLLQDLSRDLSAAIHKYTTQAKVVITDIQTSTSNPVPVTAPPPAGTGATVGPVVSSLMTPGKGELE